MGLGIEKQKKLNGITFEKLLTLSNKENSILIDLREPIEIERKASIKNSINIPYSDLQNYLKKNNNSLKSKDIIFYCAIGERSSLAVQTSQSYHLNQIYHLIGGINNI